MTEQNRLRLLKKRKGILTRYTNYQNDGWVRKYKRWMTNVTVDLSQNTEYYLNEIEKAKTIITKCTTWQINN